MSSRATIDAQERELALTPSASFIVQAPAGSGKTGLLVQRILRLLGVVDRPESIVAVTFTIKAAAEMRERVIHALIDAANGVMPQDEFQRRTSELASAALARDRSLGWGLTADPSRLHIQTIDALCARLVRQMPLVSDAGGVSSVTEDAEELYRQAARQALERLAEPGYEEWAHALFRRVALHFDNDIARLEMQIATMLSKRDGWHADLPDEMDATVEDFRAILALAEAELRNVFREHNTVDFTEVTRAAIHALGEPQAPSDLLYALDYRIEHILVDEFQDTSRAQYDLLDALTGQWSDGDGRTLFLVGDPLQSIYGFRAAEVALFQRCWEQERLGSVRLTPVRLQANFRSTPQIVDWVQSALQPVLDETDISKGAVQLQPSVAARAVLGPPPNLIPLLDDRSGEEEASEVVRILQSLNDRKDVAILVRSRSHVTAILRALRSAGIPYQAVDIDELGAQQHILDLLSLTRAITHLADRAAWLGCLRAPWCGLTLADLSAIAEGEAGRTILELISDANVIARLSPDGRMRAVRVQEILSTAVARVGRMPLRRLLERTWYALGGPAILPERNRQEDAETFFALIEGLEQGGIIHDFALLNERLKHLYAKPDNAEDCIRVMTIHEAKGLEFDTVILPHLGSAPRGDEEELLVWNEVVETDGRVRLDVAAQPRRSEVNPQYAEIREALKQKTRNEGKRLFYVACTRAKNRLYLLGSVNRNKKGQGICKAPSHTFLGMIWERSKPAFEAVERRTMAVQADLFEGFSEGRAIRRLPARWHLPAFEHSVAWRPQLELGTASQRAVTYEWVGGASRHVGTVVHGILNRIAREGLAHWPADRIQTLEPAIHSELARLGVDVPEQTTAAEQALRAVRNITASPRAQWIFSNHAQARSEWPISGRVAGRLVSGTIDRLFRDSDGQLWIIDFKTSEHQGARLDEFLNREQRRYREQMETYATLLAALEPGPISLGLYFPLLDEWRAWEFAELTSVVRGLESEPEA